MTQFYKDLAEAQKTELMVRDILAARAANFTFAAIGD